MKNKSFLPVGLIKNNLKLMLRSKWILFFITALPVLFTALLSNVFESMMNIDYTMEPFTVGYRIAENSKYASSMELIFAICEENDITLQEFPDSDIESLVSGNNTAVFIEIGDDLLTIYKHKDSEAESSIVENIFTTVFYKVNETITVLSRQTEQGLLPGTSALTADSSDEIQSEMPQPAADSSFGFQPDAPTLTTDFSSPSVATGKLQVIKADTDPVPPAKDYYGIIEIVYFMWCGCISLATVIPSERKNRIIARMRLTPTSNLQLYLGKFIPCLLATVIELAAAILVSIIFLDVHWGNWPGSIMILSLFSLAATAFGMVLFSLFSHVAVSMAVGWCLIFANGFVGGSFMTYMYSLLPDSYIRLSPQYYINRSLVEFSTQGHSDYALPCVIVLSVIFLICVAVGFPLISRKEGSYV